MEATISPDDPVRHDVASDDVFILTRSGPILRRSGRWARASGFGVVILDDPPRWRTVEGADAQALRDSARAALFPSEAAES